MKENEQELEEFIRDICKVTPMSKSEARRRLDLIIHQAIAEERAGVVELIKESKKGYAGTQYRYGKEALDDLLTSLDKPLTDKE